MKINTMRAIDYWLGIPMCFVATLVLAPFRSRRRPDPDRVLFIELSEMGSAILADPAMRKLQDRTNCLLYFLIFRKNKPSLGLLATVPDDHILTIREDSLLSLVKDTFRFLAWARKNRIDTVVDLELFSRFTALLTGFSGAANRVGFYSFNNEGLYRGNMMTHKVLYNPHIHIAKNFVALVNAVLSKRAETPYSKTQIPDSEIRLVKATPQAEQIKAFLPVLDNIVETPLDLHSHKIILINANASELLIQRRWMPGYYVELARLILTNHDEAWIFLTGSREEAKEMESLRRRVGHPRCYNTAGRFTFEQLPLLYHAAHLMVTNDSGPGHFSAVTDLEVFILFGPETPELYGSLGNAVPIYKRLACSPCVNAANHRRTSCQDNVCLQLITPREVYDTIEPSLRAAPRAAAAAGS